MRLGSGTYSAFIPLKEKEATYTLEPRHRKPQRLYTARLGYGDALKELLHSKESHRT